MTDKSLCGIHRQPTADSRQPTADSRQPTALSAAASIDFRDLEQAAHEDVPLDVPQGRTLIERPEHTPGCTGVNWEVWRIFIFFRSALPSITISVQ